VAGQDEATRGEELAREARTAAGCCRRRRRQSLAAAGFWRKAPDGAAAREAMQRAACGVRERCAADERSSIAIFSADIRHPGLNGLN